MNRFMRCCGWVACTLALCGCAGEEFYSPLTPENLVKIRKDVTTREQVVNIFGDPDAITIAPDGAMVYTYVDTVLRVRQIRLLPGIIVTGNTKITSDSHYLEVYLRGGIVRGHRHRTTLPPKGGPGTYSQSGDAPAHGEAWGPEDEGDAFEPIPAEPEGENEKKADPEGAENPAAKPEVRKRQRVGALEGRKARYDFEGYLQGWRVPRFLPIIAGKVEHTKDRKEVHGGRGALKLSYAYRKERIPLIMRHSGDFKGVRYIRFFARALYQDLTLMVGVSEGHKADYNTTVNVAVDDGWVEVNLDLADFELSDDGRDPNGKLDYDQIQGMMIADIGAFFEQTGENVLLIDDVVGATRPLDGKPRKRGRRPPKGKKVPIPNEDELLF